MTNTDTIKCIYEIRDVTEDENYYAIGTYLDKLDAEEQFKNLDPENDSAPYHDDYAEFELVKLNTGLHMGNYKTICKSEYIKKYNENNDEYEWHLKS